MVVVKRSNEIPSSPSNRGSVITVDHLLGGGALLVLTVIGVPWASEPETMSTRFPPAGGTGRRCRGRHRRGAPGGATRWRTASRRRPGCGGGMGPRVLPSPISTGGYQPVESLPSLSTASVSVASSLQKANRTSPWPSPGRGRRRWVNGDHTRPLDHVTAELAIVGIGQPGTRHREVGALGAVDLEPRCGQPTSQKVAPPGSPLAGRRRKTKERRARRPRRVGPVSGW